MDNKTSRKKEAQKRLISSIDQYHGGFIDPNDIRSTFTGMIELYDEYFEKKIIPRFQFTDDGHPIKGISCISDLLLREIPASDVARCSFFLNPLFDNRLVIDVLRNGSEGDIEIVKREASLFMSING